LPMNLTSSTFAPSKWNLFPSTSTAQLLLQIVCANSRCSKQRRPFLSYNTRRTCLT